MLESFGSRQRDLLHALLGAPEGLSVEALAARLGITRNAVRQHLAALAADGLVAFGSMRPSGGRPEQLHVLTEKGRELFPRRYSWFAELMIGLLRREHRGEGLRDRLRGLGTDVAAELRRQHPGPAGLDDRVSRLAGLMADLGYNARVQPESDQPPVIEANNCIFHQLAMKNPEICAFDLALLSDFTGADVEHQECMARGGRACRFAFTNRS
ncbi:MAG TPA: helix-turn-helix domain-containing protein [Acetobacteraceae bacterium]|nr:helix-turn-helix domain-containing protein [Acetobacteraceae bacterium]